jgi:hypothetical protein
MIDLFYVLKYNLENLIYCFREDLYHEKEVNSFDIRYEQQCVLYNIGALHSFLGCVDKRFNDEVIHLFSFNCKLIVSLSQLNKNERESKNHALIFNMQLGHFKQYEILIQDSVSLMT